MKEILLLHGALGSKEQFADLEIALGGTFKTHSINFSGHGRRPSHHHAFTIQNFAHEVLDWMNEHYIKQIDVFGYSMGGYVALWLARFYPDRIGKIYTLGTKLKWNEAEAEREIRHLNPEKVVEKVPAFAQALADRHGEHEWKSVMAKTALMMKDLAKHHLSDQDFVSIPHSVTLGLGSLDVMVTLDETEYAARLLKHGTVKVFEGIQHPLEKMPVDTLASELMHTFK